MENKKKRVVSGVIACALVCTLLPGGALAADVGYAARPVSLSAQAAAEKTTVIISKSDSQPGEKFVNAAMKGNTIIRVQDGVNITVQNSGQDEKETSGSQKGRMKPVLFAEGTEVIGEGDASLSFRSPMQLAGDNVSFKDIVMKFTGSDGVGAIPHREIFLAGYGLTLDHVVTDNPNGGGIGGFGSSEENQLPLVFAGGYKSEGANSYTVGQNARLTVRNVDEGKCRFQAIYTSHDEKTALGPMVQAPVATNYNGPVLLELVPQTEVVDLSKNSVKFPSGIFAEQSTNTRINVTGTGSTNIKPFTLHGNESVQLAIDKAILTERSVIQSLGTLELKNGAQCYLEAGDTVDNVILPASTMLFPKGSAKINNKLQGGGTVRFLDNADILEIGAEVSGNSTITQWTNLSEGLRLITPKNVAQDAFRMAETTYEIKPREVDGKLHWEVKNVAAQVSLGTVQFKQGQFTLDRLSVDVSKLEEDGIDSTEITVVCSDTTGRYIKPTDTDYVTLLHTVAVKKEYWDGRDSGQYDGKSDWLGSMFLTEAEGSGRDKYKMYVGFDHKSGEEYVFLAFKSADLLPQEDADFRELRKVAIPENLANKDQIFPITLTEGTPPPAPPVPPVEITYNLTAPQSVAFGEPVTFTFNTSDTKGQDKWVALYKDGEKLAEQQVEQGTARLTYDTKDRRLQPGSNEVKAVYGSKAEIGAVEKSQASAAVEIQAKPLSADLFQKLTPEVFSGSKIEPAVLPVDAQILRSEDYTVSYRNNEQVGQAAAVVTAQSGGYYSGTAELPFTIEKAVFGDREVESGAKYGTAGTLDVSGLICPGGRVTAVAVKTDDKKILERTPAMDSAGKTLQYAVAASAVDHVGSTAQITLSVDAPNYQSYTITVTVTAQDKLPQTGFAFEKAAEEKLYSDEDFVLMASGAVAGSIVTYESDNSQVASVNVSSGKVHITGVGVARITARASATDDYSETVTGYTLTVNKGIIQIKAKDKTAKVNDKAPVLGVDDYTVEGLRAGEKLGVEPTIRYKIMPDMTKPGTVDIEIFGAEAMAGKSDCYELHYASGRLTIKSGSSGGGGTSHTSKPEIEHHADGSVTEIIKKPDGTTVETTVTPQGEKIVAESKKDGSSVVTVTDKQGNKSVTKTKPDGSSVTEAKQVDGTTATTKVDQAGRVQAEVVISGKAVEQAKYENKPVALPLSPLEAKQQAENAPVIRVNTGVKEQLTVMIPVKQATPGVVAVILRKDGTEKVVSKAVVKNDFITLSVENGESIRLQDRAKRFADTQGHWAEEAIDFATGHALYQGTSSDTFTPDGGMTRGMLAEVLHNLEGNPDSIKSNDFKDVHVGEWYDKAVQWTVEKGIVSGYGNGNFGPNDCITREQMAVMLYRYAGSPALSQSGLRFSDSNKVSSYAQQAVQWAVEEHILNGVGGNILEPQGTATRAQAAAMLMRFLENVQ